MRGDIKWTNLSRRQIAERMGALGTPVSRDVVSQLLRQHGYRRRKTQKKMTMGHHRDRNVQFEKIARLRKKYRKAGLPVISIDTKKKELLGDFYREGRIDAQATIETNDHDFSSAGSGVVIPHGVYDVGRNRGFLHLNTSHDTSELACDSIAAWWDEHGRSEYPGAKKILVLCDGGGSNSARRYVFKDELQKLALRLGVEIRVGALSSLLLKVQPDRTPAVPARYYMAKASMQAGLTVTVTMLEKVYETGRKCAEGFKESMTIAFDKVLPKWNYRAIPSKS